METNIVIRGLKQNNLKNISLEIPKNKIVVFTGVSGSGKSSIVFDTVAAESQRQMNETYPAWVRGRLPKYEKPNVEYIVDRGNTVVVIEHNTDVMKMADYIIDVGPDGGTKGGQIVFTGTPEEMVKTGETITAKYLRKSLEPESHA